ncbi:DUF3592 domain-containing protein [Streptomyces sp. NBC_00448]|uniref:DUF3592 domain-containing protein n=1 Tax=Streptomyces sp. NBC_00448 TaxID=2903652 RepID=UPI002E1AB768
MGWALPATSCHTGNCTGKPIDPDLPYVVLACVGVVVVLYAIGQVVIAIRRKQVLKHGVPAQAVIREITARRGSAYAEDVKADVTLVFSPASGEEVEGWTTARFPTAALPEPGWTVPVRYWAKEPQRVAVAGAAAPPVRPD